MKDFNNNTFSEKKFVDLIKEVNQAKVYDKGLQQRAREHQQKTDQMHLKVIIAQEKLVKL